MKIDIDEKDLFEVKVKAAREGYIIRVVYPFEDPLGDVDASIAIDLEKHGFVPCEDEPFMYYCSKIASFRLDMALDTIFGVERAIRRAVSS